MVRVGCRRDIVRHLAASITGHSLWQAARWLWGVSEQVRTAAYEDSTVGSDRCGEVIEF
jgi:hypothetical protein